MSELLPMALAIAVPMEIDRAGRLSAEQRIDLGRRSADILTEHGDDLLFGGKYCRETFAAAARALGAGAHQPGGIRFAGTLWCARHHQLGVTADWPCESCVLDPETPPPGPRPVVTVEPAGGVL